MRHEKVKQELESAEQPGITLPVDTGLGDLLPILQSEQWEKILIILFSQWLAEQLFVHVVGFSLSLSQCVCVCVHMCVCVCVCVCGVCVCVCVCVS